MPQGRRRCSGAGRCSPAGGPCCTFRRPEIPRCPADLADWFTERAFHFYLAGLRLPGRVTPPARPGGRALGSACADLNAACARLRGDDGMGHVIVTAQRRGALAAALWSDEGARCEGALANGAPVRGLAVRGLAVRGLAVRGLGADALVLLDPELPARPALTLSIACPVLVVTTGGQPASGGRRGLLPRRPAAPAAAAQLGGHVTWLQLPDRSALLTTGGRGSSTSSAAGLVPTCTGTFAISCCKPGSQFS